MGVEYDSSTNPDKVRTGNRKTNYSDRLKDVLTGDYKFTSAWPPDEPYIGL